MEPVSHVEHLCRSLFMVFEFAEFDMGVYAEIVSRFIDGEVA